MNYLKQSTAATIKIGPFVDDTDGKTAETGLTISQADIRLSKNGGAFAQTNNSAGATHDENGYYGVPLDTTDTNTLGRLRVAISKSGALPVWQDFMIVPANVYDSLVSGSDYINAEVAAMAADVITSNAFDESTAFPLKSADTGATAVARTGADSDTLETLSDQIDLQATASALSTHDGKLDTVDGIVDSIAADTDEIQQELADGGRTDLLIDGIKAKTDNLPTDPADESSLEAAITAAHSTTDGKIDALNDLSSGDVETAVGTALATYDPPTKTEMDSGFSGLNDISAAEVNAEVDQALSDYDAPTKAEMDAAFTEIKGGTWSSETDTLEHIRDKQTDIEADTQDLQTQVGTDGAGLTALPWNSAWDAEVQSEAADALTAYDPPTKAELDNAVSPLATSEALATVDGNVDSILADTDEIQQELADGGRTDLLVDAIKAKTDLIPASPAATGDIPSAASVADAVWDEAIADHTTGTSFGAKNQKVVPSETIGDYKADVSALANETYGLAALKALIDTIDGIVDVISGHIQADYTATIAGRIDAAISSRATSGDIPSAATVADAVLDEALGEHAGFLTTLLTAAGYTAPANSDITTILERLTATRAGYLDLLNTYLDVAISSRLASAGYTAPDNASIAAILEDTGELQENQSNWLTANVSDLALEASVQALNNLSAAEVNAEVDSALSDYDGPTATEMDAALALIATAADLATVDGLIDTLIERLTATRAGYLDNLTNLDALISSRLASSGYTAPDNASITSILEDTAALEARLTATRAGYLDLLNTYLDAAISSRAAASTALSSAVWTSEKAGYLDMAISEVEAASAPTVEEIRAEMDDNSSKLANLDAAISSRLATSGYTAPDNASIAAILEDTGTTIPALIAALNIDQGETAAIYTVYDTDDVTPLQGVRVVVTTGSDGSGYVTTKWTDAFGKVYLQLNSGTYYLWRWRVDRIFTDPDTEVVE